MGLILEEINGMLKNEDISETCKSILYGVVILLVLVIHFELFSYVYKHHLILYIFLRKGSCCLHIFRDLLFNHRLSRL